MRDESVWTARTRTLPSSAAILLALILIFYWRAASDDESVIIAQLDVETLERDGALRVPPGPDKRYRLLSHGLLHAGVQHLFNNGISIYLGCYLLEPCLGSARTLLVFIGGVLGGAAARLTLKRKGLLVGASGGAFALNGAMLALVLLPGARVPELERQGMEIFMAVMLGMGLLLSFVPNISLAAHVGGALAGMLLVATGLLTLGRPTLQAGEESQMAATIAWLVAAPAVAALAFSGYWVRRLGRRASASKSR
jgi:rhomboid protease GluP